MSPDLIDKIGCIGYIAQDQNASFDPCDGAFGEE